MTSATLAATAHPVADHVRRVALDAPTHRAAGLGVATTIAAVNAARDHLEVVLRVREDTSRRLTELLAEARLELERTRST